MGLFGFGRKKKKQQDDERLAEAVERIGTCCC